MGCVSSKPSNQGDLLGVSPSANPNSAKEDTIKIALKNKRQNRANVFNAGLELETRDSFKLKNIPKSSAQEDKIRSALAENFVFTALEESDLKQLINAFTVRTVKEKEDVITQGEDGDYFYVIDKGSFAVIVDGKQVSILSETSTKSFGELALMHNAKRAASVRSLCTSTLFALDRDTFRFVIATSQDSRSNDVRSALTKVPLLSSLTEKQLQKICDSVEIVPYKTGDVIIKKGDVGDIFFMIKSGRVTVTEVNASNEVTYGPGDYFGERALLTGDVRAATVKAISDVAVMVLDRDSFTTLLGPLRDLIDYNMNIKVLKSMTLFEKLTDKERDKVSKSFSIEHFAVGAKIINQKDKGSKFYILKSGTVKILKDGNHVAELSEGAYFGEMALLSDEVRMATVVAVTECDCFTLDRETFIKIMGNLEHIMKRETKKRLEGLKGASTDDLEEEGHVLLKFEQLKEIAVLGSGTFGRVSLVEDKKSKQFYALKAMLKSEIVAHKQQKNVINEKNVMMCCNHPFILRLYQTFKDNRRLYMLLEFIQGGELFSVLHTNTSDGIPDASAKFYAAGVILAIAYLHSKEIAYRDMKPENCLIDKFGYPKIVDFGFAKLINGKSYTLCGTPEYLSPELVLGRGHNKSVDYWAFGILIYEMQAGYSPFADNQSMDQVVICRNIVNCKLSFPRNFDADCKDLTIKLLAKEIHTRLGNLKGGTDDIKNHAWFKSMNFDSYTAREMKAPWVPKVKSSSDISNFDPIGADEHVDNSKYQDKTNWDKDF